MGPETTPEHMSEDLMQAVTCLRRVMDGMKNCPSEQQQPAEIEQNHPTDVIYTLEKITKDLERCMENNKTLNDVLSGKMKCTTCGSTSVGFLSSPSDCHDSATSTTTTASHRSSEEPRRKNSGEECCDEMDEVCSSIGTRSIRSVSSSVNQDDEDTMVATEDMKAEDKTMEEEEEEHDLVMKTILSTTTPGSMKQEVKKEEVEPDDVDAAAPSMDAALLDQFLQNSLLGLPDMKAIIDMPTDLAGMANNEENEDDKDGNQLLNNFFQILFANQNAGSPGLDESTENNTDSSSQPSPPADGSPFDSMAIIESLLAESMNQSDSSPATTSSAESKAAAQRKKKSTPIKVPKSDNGGYVCPMDGCNKIFKEKGSVHRHFVTHIGMRFNCDKCKASYTQKHALMLHQKIHANPDAYQCRGCGTNYTTQNGLRLHRQRNPACLEHNTSASMQDFNSTLSSLSEALSLQKSNTTTPTKQMVLAAP